MFVIRKSHWWVALLGCVWLLLGGVAVYRQLTDGSADFHEFWRISRHLLYGEEAGRFKVPYSYPPLFHLLIACFSWMPLGVASACWYVFCSACAIFSVRMLAALCDLRGRFLVLAVLVSTGLMVNDLLMGNANLVILLCIVSGLYLFCRGREFGAGSALAAGAALKLIPALLVIYFLWKARVRVVVGAAICFVVCVAVLPPLLVGPASGTKLTRNWIGQMLPMLGLGTPENALWYEKEDIYRGTNQSLLAVTHRFLRPVKAVRGGGEDGTVNVAVLEKPTVTWIYRGLVLVTLVGAAYMLRAKVRPGDPATALQLEYALVVVLMLLLGKVTWVNYLVHLAVPYFVLMKCVAEAPLGCRRRQVTATLLGVAAVCAVVGSSAVMQAYALPFAGVLAVGGGLVYNLLAEQTEAAGRT